MCEYAFWFGVEGIAAFAISALDTALWDLKGKLMGKPVAELLGDPVKAAAPAAAAIILDMEDLDWTLAEFDSFAKAGYRVVKGGGGLKPDALIGQDRVRDTRYVSEIRHVIGDQVSLVIDIAAVHGLWDVDTAIERVRAWEQFHLRWIEQPLRPSDLSAYARLRSAVSTPLGTGEDEWSPETYQWLIRSGGVDVVQVDPGRCLGRDRVPRGRSHGRGGGVEIQRPQLEQRGQHRRQPPRCSRSQNRATRSISNPTSRRYNTKLWPIRGYRKRG